MGHLGVLESDCVMGYLGNTTSWAMLVVAAAELRVDEVELL
jgi:hypothetical protein